MHTIPPLRERIAVQELLGTSILNSKAPRVIPPDWASSQRPATSCDTARETRTLRRGIRDSNAGGLALKGSTVERKFKPPLLPPLALLQSWHSPSGRSTFKFKNSNF